MLLIDSHAHYDDGRFEREYEGGAFAALRDAKAAGVLCVVNSGADLETSRASVSLASRGGGDLPEIYASVGIHPTETGRYKSLNEALDGVRVLAGEKRVVAIGEIGLDYHYPDTDRETQLSFFDAQYGLAEELLLPVVIHDREAHGDVFDIVRAHPNVKTVLHSYSGSAEMARQYGSLGVFMSFGGVLTFKNAEKTREAAKAVPRELLMLETDAPYLAPTPHRGKINTSAYMVYTAGVLGSLFGTDADEAASRAAEVSRRFFGI